MSSFLKSTLARLKPSKSPSSGAGQASRPEQLFSTTDPAVDGEECLHDCSSCTIKLPNKWKIDESHELYGQVKGWETHAIVATGQSDWIRDVQEIDGSVMQAIGQHSKLVKGKIMVSASNMPTPAEMHNFCPIPGTEEPTTVLLLPSFLMVDNVVPSNTPELLTQYLAPGPTNSSPLEASTKSNNSTVEPKAVPTAALDGTPTANSPSTSPSNLASAPEPTTKNGTEPSLTNPEATTITTSLPPPTTPVPDLTTLTLHRTRSRASTTHKSRRSVSLLPAPPLAVRPCPHKYLILLCSHKTRDARCGQSAPLLAKEFARHLRERGLQRDLHDERPGGVGLYFINHVGGHKYAANVLVYRKAENGEAGQCIWLARVRPEDCENIVRYTVLQGKVVKPERQLRGGFDREKGLTSW